VLCCILACVLFASLHACWLVYMRLLASLLDGLDDALVSLCVWNAGSKCNAPDPALVMFEGLLLLCFHLVLFNLTIIYYITFHFISCILNMTVHLCAVLFSCLCVVCMLACWCTCDC
jgi:hypothetical protein